MCFLKCKKGFGLMQTHVGSLRNKKNQESQITVRHSYTRFNNLFKEIYLRHCLVNLLVLCRKTNHYKR